MVIPLAPTSRITRSGVIEKEDFRNLLLYVKENCPDIHFKGIFSHDGSSYNAADLEACREIDLTAQKRTLEFAAIAEELGMKP